MACPLYPSFRDIPKGDLRRVLRVLVAISDLARGATLHYVAREVGASWSEVARAIDIAENQMAVSVIKEGPKLAITGWGVLKQREVVRLLRASRLAGLCPEVRKMGLVPPVTREGADE